MGDDGKTRSGWKQNLFLAVVAIFIALLVGEVGVRWLSPQDLSGTWRVELDDGLIVNRSNGTARHQLGARVVEYQFSSPHLRGPVPSDSEFKVLVLGDAYTFGWLVASEDSFVGHWREMAKNEFGVNCFAFLNASAGSWGTADQLAYAERFVGELRPDLMISVLNRYDIDRALRTRLYELNGDKPVPKEPLNKFRFLWSDRVNDTGCRIA